MEVCDCDLFIFRSVNNNSFGLLVTCLRLWFLLARGAAEVGSVSGIEIVHHGGHRKIQSAAAWGYCQLRGPDCNTGFANRVSCQSKSKRSSTSKIARRNILKVMVV